MFVCSKFPSLRFFFIYACHSLVCYERRNVSVNIMNNKYWWRVGELSLLVTEPYQCLSFGTCTGDFYHIFCFNDFVPWCLHHLSLFQMFDAEPSHSRVLLLLRREEPRPPGFTEVPTWTKPRLFLLLLIRLAMRTTAMYTFHIKRIWSFHSKRCFEINLR